VEAFAPPAALSSEDAEGFANVQSSKSLLFSDPKMTPALQMRSRVRKLIRFCAGLVICVNLVAVGAAARTFPIPAERPVATIEVPDDWHPVSTRDGVEGAAGNGVVRLVVQFVQASHLEAAAGMAMTKLTLSGVVLSPDTRRAAPRRYNGLDALEIDYSGTDPNGQSDIALILVAMPGKSGFVAVCYWGDDEAQESVGNDLQSIAESLVPAK
jgi:hypothetical protein